MKEIFVSSGAFIGRPNNRDYKLLGDVSSHFKNKIEIIIYEEWYPYLDKVSAFVNNNGIKVGSLHAEKFIGEFASMGDDKEALRRMEENARFAKSVGVNKIVLHLWNGKPSDSNFERNIKIFPYFYEICDKYGCELLPENVVCAIGSPIARLAQLSDLYPYARFTFDVKMSEFHKELDKVYGEYAYLFKDKIGHVHINDYKGGYKDFSNLITLHIGKGEIDFNKFFGFLKNNKYEDTLTLECLSLDKEGNMHFEDMQQSVDLVNEMYERR